MLVTLKRTRTAATGLSVFKTCPMMRPAHDHPLDHLPDSKASITGIYFNTLVVIAVAVVLMMTVTTKATATATAKAKATATATATAAASAATSTITAAVYSQGFLRLLEL